ncbi:MAG: DNA repair protein RadA [Chloroflexi bacterium]|nr:DNA repair protein RadA [Chloroflexota bacterium]
MPYRVAGDDVNGHTRGMVKSSSKTQFECNACGRVTAKWVGKCSQCGEWNTVAEARVPAKARSRMVTDRTGIGTRAIGDNSRTVTAVELNQIPTDGTAHMPTGLQELDRVLGGGFVAGSTTLLAGDPGIGKSTLLLQAAAAIAETGRTVLYATGEEALEQIRIRASRLGVKGDRVFMAGTGDVLDIAGHITAIEPAVVIVDSIQTATHPDLDSPSGTVSQIRECAAFLSEIARASHTALMLSGHVTKDGNIAGPRVLEHQVDAVLQMGGDPSGTLRLLHGVKNRFGPTDEVGVFEMREEGLIGISDPSQVFIQQRAKAVSGSAIALVVEGTRSLAVEIQALATPSSLASPRRVANGVEMSRVHLITAVLAKHMRLPVSSHDLVISVTGGLDIREPAADLAIALAIASSMMDRPVNDTIAVAGEIGLSGELRSIPRADRRAAEAGRLGFATCMIPDAAGDAGKSKSVRVVRPTNIAEAVRFALQPSSGSAVSEPVSEAHRF